MQLIVVQKLGRDLMDVCAVTWSLEPCQVPLSVQHTVVNNETNQKLSMYAYVCVSRQKNLKKYL